MSRATISNKNSAAMMGSVKLKSKSAAFSISTAREGGATASEAARTTEMDLGRERSWWSLGILDRGGLGKESWIGESFSFGVGGMVEEQVIRALEEAMSMLAMPSLFLLVVV